MIEEFDMVALTRSFPELGLAEGDLGTVLRRFNKGRTFDVEFITAQGRPVAILTLARTGIRRLADDEVLHARRLRFF